MTVNGQPVDRRIIHEELERARTDLHHLVAGATTANLRRRTNGTRWTNQQMLWHMAFGYLPTTERIGRWTTCSGCTWGRPLQASVPWCTRLAGRLSTREIAEVVTEVTGDTFSRHAVLRSLHQDRPPVPG